MNLQQRRGITESDDQDLIAGLKSFGGVRETETEIAEDIQQLSHWVTVDWTGVYPVIDKINEMIEIDPDWALKRLDELENFIAKLEAKGVGLGGEKTSQAKTLKPVPTPGPQRSEIQKAPRDKSGRYCKIDWSW